MLCTGYVPARVASTRPILRRDGPSWTTSRRCILRPVSKSYGLNAPAGISKPGLFSMPNHRHSLIFPSLT